VVRRPSLLLAVVRSLAALAALVLLAVPAVARAEGTLRTVLVIDASSSMLSTDPRELRKVAAELFVDLARYGDEVAVTGFDGGVRESTGGFIAIRSPEDRAKLKAAVRAVGKNGAWTDFTQGLLEAKRLLDAVKKEPGDQSFVVFLTDGRCDPEPKGPLTEAARAAKVGVEAFCKQKVLDVSVPALGDARLFAVGLSRSAPRDFLDEAARRTGGVGVATDNAEDLPRMFADVYARLLGSTLVDGASAATIPIVVEEGALSLDVVLVGPKTLTARLLRPDGAPVPTDNARPDINYFVDGPAYRFFKVAMPATGAFRLEVGGGGKGGRYAALQNLDLRLAFTDPPEVLEIGKQGTFVVRLATPGGRVPNVAFLDRHKVTVASAYKDRCSDPWLDTGARALPRGPDGAYGFTLGGKAPGHLCLVAELTPGPGGVLTRKSKMVDVRLVPPLRLKARVVHFGSVRQRSDGTGSIDFTESEIGEAVQLQVSLANRPDLTLKPAAIALLPKGNRMFELKLLVDKDAAPGKAKLTVSLQPTEPRGYEDRAIDVDVEVDVVPLTFWERHGLRIKVGAGVLLFFIVLFGVLLPARFKRALILHYKDVRDPELPREGTYPLGVKVKAGFYRGAKVALAATGPVRAGGVIELRPAPGGGVIARPLGGRKVKELPREDASGMGLAGEAREVPLVKGAFRCAVSTRYEVDGAGLVFWTDVRGR